jgi:2-keto-4-pentenoate hydratase
MSADVEAAAERLREAYSAGPIAPLRDLLEPRDVDGAYAIQSINTRHWIDSGRRVVGRKVGLTAETVQRQLGVDQPDFGVIFDDMLIPNGGLLPHGRTLQARAETEVALVLGQDLAGPDVGFYDVMVATAYVLPAIEIVDSRIADWKITFADTVADNASSAFVVLGDRPQSLAGLDLVSCRMTMSFDDQVVSQGVGSACLGHPLNAAAWLARTLASRGEALRAGDIIMTGALGPMASLPPGVLVNATIEGLGSVGFSVERAPS